MSLDALKASGLVQPGSLNRFVYRVMLPDGDDAAVEKLMSDARAACRRPAGRSARGSTPIRASPAASSAHTQFLTLVGLTALLVGGVGVANAVRAFVERKRASIATLKSLGPPGARWSAST